MIDLEQLRPYATAHEQRVIDAVIEHGGNKAAASRALGIRRESVRSALTSARRRFETGTLPSPRGPSTAPYHIPEGHELKGVSTLVNAQGEQDAAWHKSQIASAPPAVAPVPEGFTLKRVSSYTGPDGSVRAQWRSADLEQQQRWDMFWAAAEREATKFRGLAAMLPPAPRTASELLTVYPLGDPHIGMLSWAPETGEHFDLHIAEKDLISCINLLVSGAPASKRALLANLGDFYHAQDDSQLTPRGGNKLDVDGRRAKVLQLGLRMMGCMVDRLLSVHEQVHVVNVPGNHDPGMAIMVALWLDAIYKNEPRVTIESPHNPYIYVTHGSTLLGFAHGDGAKMDQLPGVMATDRPELWGAARFRHWLTGHVHHQVRKEHPGCTVESFRTLAARDYWHHHKGYRSQRSLSAITYHDVFGEITRGTVDLSLARSDLSVPPVVQS